MKKFLATLLATVVSVSCLFSVSACGTGKETIDDSKTQLYVYFQAGGFGVEWFRELKRKFEDEYANVTYEEGKKGVQIIVDEGKQKASGVPLDSTVNEVLFNEEVPYFDYVSQGKLLDISDVFNDIIAQDGVSVSGAQKGALTALDGKYYAIPYEETTGGVIYDKDLFNNESLYFDADGNFTDSSDPNLSVGPDGESGTFDDGLPATIEQFLELCEEMKTGKSITPFIVTGEYAQRYVMLFADRFAACYDGVKTKMANYTFAGDGIKVIDSITQDSSPLGYSITTKSVDINNSNGYLLRQTPGRFYALLMLKKFIDGDYFYKEALNGTITHMDAQEMYINSTFTNKPVAMFMEGVWWENESSESGAFDRSVTNHPGQKASKKDRNFGYMPMPTKANDSDTNESASPFAALDMYNAFAFVKSSIAPYKIKLAKDYLRFIYRADNLEYFTAQTGLCYGLQYKISDETYNSLSNFSKDVWDTHTRNDIIYGISSNKMYYENENDFATISSWTATVGKSTFVYPWQSWKSASPVTVQQYYEGNQISVEDWNKKYSKYFL